MADASTSASAVAAGVTPATDSAAVPVSAAGRIEPMFIADDFSMPLESFVIPPQYKPYLSHVMIPHGMIADRVEKIAEDILKQFPTSTPHLLVVLQGANEFGGDLTRAMKNRFSHGVATHIPYTVSYVRVKSYEGTSSTGSVKISGIDMRNISGRDIVVVEDIVDTGLTMTSLIPELRKYGATSVRVATLLEKRTPRSCGFKSDFVGFSVPDAFVVGYNLDYNEAFRDLAHICVINKAGIAFFAHHETLAGLYH